MLRKLILITIGIASILAGTVYAAFQISPWPSVWLVRHSFDEGAQRAHASIAPYIPKGIIAQRELRYAADASDALFDIFAPPGARNPLPAVLWVHGGGKLCPLPLQYRIGAACDLPLDVVAFLAGIGQTNQGIGTERDALVLAVQEIAIAPEP